MAYLSGRRGGRKGSHKRPERRDDIDMEKLRQLYRDLEEAHREMRESHMEMILNLAIAAKYKDPDTGHHILRISDYATELAKAVGLPDEEIEILRFASPMHDIGKIGIPDRILQKPGKLTPEEWEIMKQHPQIGSRIFQNSRSPLLKAIAEISLNHHERFDGKGYPNGLRGKQIPISSRIVALVDVFDAVVSRRCYKSASSFNEGMEYVQSLAGTHLDPEVVEAFVAIKDKIKKVYEANKTIQQFIEDSADDLKFDKK